MNKPLNSNQRAFCRALIKLCVNEGFGFAYEMQPIADGLGIKETLYDEDNSTGLLWELGPHGEGLLDISNNGKCASLYPETYQLLEHWASETINVPVSNGSEQTSDQGASAAANTAVDEHGEETIDRVLGDARDALVDLNHSEEDGGALIARIDAALARRAELRRVLALAQATRPVFSHGVRSDGSKWISIGNVAAAPHFACDIDRDTPAWALELLTLSTNHHDPLLRYAEIVTRELRAIRGMDPADSRIPKMIDALVSNGEHITAAVTSK